MGDNETAGFDPTFFFFHSCFIDYVFWLWQQKHNCTAAGSLKIDSSYPGAQSVDGSVGSAPGTLLTPASLPGPFQGLGYTYAPDSLAAFDRSDCHGVFRDPHPTSRSGKVVGIGREGGLSRWNIYGCKNCQTNLHAKATTTPISRGLLEALKDGDDDFDVTYAEQGDAACWRPVP